MEKKSIKVQIFGMDYSLKSDKDPEYIKQVAEFVDEKIQKLSTNTNVKSQTKIAVLVALNIADELFQLKKHYENSLKVFENIELNSKELCDSVDDHLNQFLKISE
jgi:cell division protein ZapA